MLTFLDNLRELTPLSMLVRLILALLFGGLLGLHGTRKQRLPDSVPICWSAWVRP